MSSERRLPLNQAERLAEELVELLRPACERIAVAGSIRRRKADIGDIELVAVPKDEEALDLFGGRVSVSFDQDQLTDRVCGLLVDNIMAPRKDANGRIRFGSRYKALLYQGVAVDLFSVLPPMCKKCGIMLPTRTGQGEGSDAISEDRETVPPLRQESYEPAGSLGLLQPKLRPDGLLRQEGPQGDEELSRNLRGLPAAVPAQMVLQGGADLWREVRGDPEGARGERQEGLSRAETCDDEGELPEGVRSDAPEGGQGRQGGSASVGDGDAHWPSIRGLGEGASSERRQDGQPHRELGDSHAGTSRWLGNLPPLPQVVPGQVKPPGLPPCPHCGASNWQAPQWGVIFLLRTGPADFSRRFVTPRRQGGMLPEWALVKDGAIWHRSTGKVIETPEEDDVWKLLGIEPIPPEARR